MAKKIFAAALAASMLASCSAGTDVNEQTNTEATAENMAVEEKVGQLFMVRCDSANMDHILSMHPGGILMFAVDFEGLSQDEVKSKINGYKSGQRITPYIAVDEEGGTVVRVSANSALAPEKYESPQFYYNSGGLPAIIDNTAEKSELLKSLGISMNLAPVADVSQNPEDFIYDRSLGQDAETTASYVSAVVQTAKQHNIASCLKHFPGYGGNVDTHTGIAVDTRPIPQFYENDFLPFQAGIAAGAEAVLVAHNIITDVDDTEPASISPSVHDILRNDLGFGGIVMTDDMSMDAMAEYSEPYKKAVLAGNDMIIVTDFDTAYNEVLNAVNNGEIPMDTLDSAVSRILAYKKSLDQQTLFFGG